MSAGHPISVGLPGVLHKNIIALLIHPMEENSGGRRSFLENWPWKFGRFADPVVVGDQA